MLDFTTRSNRRLLPAAAIAVLSLACVGDVGNPTLPTDVELRIHSTFNQSQDFARIGLVIDRVTATVWALPSDTVAEISQMIAVDQQTVDLAASLPVSGETTDFGVSVQFWSGVQALFQGQDTIQIESGAASVDLVMDFDFVGPGGDISFMVVSPQDTTLTFGAQLPMRLEAFDGNESQVDPYFVSWTTDDPAVSIDAAGVLTAGMTRDSVLVTATAPNDVAASATVFFQPAPSSVEAESGDGATAAAGTSVSLVARVIGSDGLALSGVTVAFAATSGGGSVNPAQVVSDALGLAATTATLGSTPGTQTFEASVAGLTPATFTVEAILRAPAIELAPNALNFSASQGSNPSPASRTFTVTNTGNESLSWTATDNQPWMSVSPGSGSLNPGAAATVTVTVASSSLSPATYNGTVTVSDPAAANSPQTVDVTLEVSPPGPALGLSPATLNFSVTQGANPANQQITVTNVGGLPLTWSANDNQPWLALTPTSGSLNAGQSTNVTAAVTSSALAPGTYTATVTVTSGEAVNSPQTMTVNLTVAAPPATITLSPGSLSFTAQEGSNPAAQNLTIGNSGGSTLNWSASDNQTWLTMGSTSGSVAPSGSTSVPVNVTSSGLAAGTYNATITITGTGASNTPQTVSVALTVTPGPPTISLSPDTLFYSAQAGNNPASQNMSVGNTGGTTLSWTGSDNQPWLSLGTTSGSVAAGGSANVAVNVASSALAPGTYNGTVTVSASGATNSPQTLAVVLTVTVAPGTIALTPDTLFFTTAEFTTPPDQPMLIENTGAGALTWSGSDNQPWLTLRTTSGTIPALDSTVVQVSASAASLSEGTYTGVVTISDPGATNSPQTLVVVLTATGTPSISVSRSIINFTAPEGLDPFVHLDTFSVTNSGTGTLNWTATPQGGSWATVDPTSGSLTAGQSENDILIDIFSSSLSPGSYQDFIEVADPAAGNSPQLLELGLTVTDDPPVITSISDGILEFFDQTRCQLGSFTGDRYEYIIDYSDADGDGDLGTIEAIVPFDTIGDGEVSGPAVYETNPPAFFESSDGFDGVIVWEFCIAFQDEFEATLKFVMDDFGGHLSDTVSITTFVSSLREAPSTGAPRIAPALSSGADRATRLGRAGDAGTALGSRRGNVTRRPPNRQQ